MASDTDGTQGGPAHVRKPQIPNFEYNRAIPSHRHILQGLGIQTDLEQKSVIDTLKTFVRDNHPGYNPDTDLIDVHLEGKPRDEFNDQAYDHVLQFCAVPRTWRTWAMSKVMTYVITQKFRKNRVIRPKVETRLNSATPAARRRRTSSDDESEPKPMIKRLKVASPETPSKFPPRRSHRDSITPLRDNSTPYHGHSLDKVFFCTVKDGEIVKVTSEVDAIDLSDGDPPTLRWNMLADEARTLDEDPGFQFSKALYLSPRVGQEMPIRSQASLSTALRGMPPGVLHFTTEAVKVAVKPEHVQQDGRSTPSRLEPSALSKLDADARQVQDRTQTQTKEQLLHEEPTQANTGLPQPEDKQPAEDPAPAKARPSHTEDKKAPEKPAQPEAGGSMVRYRAWQAGLRPQDEHAAAQTVARKEHENLQEPFKQRGVARDQVLTEANKLGRGRPFRGFIATNSETSTPEQQQPPLSESPPRTQETNDKPQPASAPHPKQHLPQPPAAQPAPRPDQDVSSPNQLA
jgi:hypothetical protein